AANSCISVLPSWSPLLAGATLAAPAGSVKSPGQESNPPAHQFGGDGSRRAVALAGRARPPDGHGPGPAVIDPHALHRDCADAIAGAADVRRLQVVVLPTGHRDQLPSVR